MRVTRPLSLAVLSFIAVGCAAHKPQASNRPVWVSGQAKVVEVNDAIGTAVLKIDDRNVNVFWDTQVEYAQGKEGDVAAGIARDPIVQAVKFPAKVGDTVAYSGLETHGEILLRGLRVLPH